VTTVVSAHHSQSQFDSNATISVNGTLTRASWANPHALFFVQGKRADTDEPEKEWVVEGPGIRQIELRGWGKTISKAGDKLKFTGRPRLDGKPELLLETVTLADGRTFNFKPE
jgi:hypothetical protein